MVTLCLGVQAVCFVLPRIAQGTRTHGDKHDALVEGRFNSLASLVNALSQKASMYGLPALKLGIGYWQKGSNLLCQSVGGSYHKRCRGSLTYVMLVDHQWKVVSHTIQTL